MLLVNSNTVHVSRVDEIPVETGENRVYVLWFTKDTSSDEEVGDLSLSGGHNGVHDLWWRGTHVLLVNTFEETSYLRFKPKQLNVLTAANAVAIVRVRGQVCKRKMCSWTVIAGDSNTRSVVNLWVDSMDGGFSLGRKATFESLPTCDQDERWSDNEWVFADKDSCHIITQRFLTDQDKEGIARMAVDMKAGTFCGTKLTDSLRANERRPEKPGLWWS